jgi:hypothetical protein
MRMIFINAICGGAIGGILGFNGLDFLTWQFWVIMGCVLCIIINSGVE